jgi:D-serine deaminase-like pyridoxal phosphate-dependent protein
LEKGIKANFSWLHQDYPCYANALADLPLPLAWLDLDALQENCRRIAKYASGKPVRIVTKSIRCPEVLRTLLAMMPDCRGLMAYHAAEAVFLVEQGFDNILIAYPTLQVKPLEAVAVQVQKGADITCMADSPAHLVALNQAGQSSGVILPCCLDVDMSIALPGIYFGVHRSPLNTAEKVAELLLFARNLPCIRIVGYMGYEAQIAGVADRIPGKSLQNAAMPLLKIQGRRSVLKRREAVSSVFRKLDMALDIVNGGGTGSLPFTANDPSVNEVAAGSGFFAPVLFDYYQDLEFVPAAGFALEVVRQPARGILTCGGGGYVASGSAGREKLPMPWLPGGLQLDEHEGAGEVQTPLNGNVDLLLPGAPVFFRHAKAGELCERFNALTIISAGKVIDDWQTYRGLGKNFM